MSAHDHWNAHWGVLIAEQRSLGSGPVASVEVVLESVGVWRRDRCASASALLPRVEAVTVAALGALTLDELMPVEVMHVPEEEARAYFAARPEASRSPNVPAQVGLLLGRLQVAAREPKGWVAIPDFDDAMAAAYGAGALIQRGAGAAIRWGWNGLPASPDAVLADAQERLVPSLTTGVRELVRQRFAAAFLEVVQHAEAERRRHAAVLLAADAYTTAPEAIRAAPAPAAYTAREGDRTLGEVMDLYRSERIARHGRESTDRKYRHLFRAIEETLERDKPIRAVIVSQAVV